MKLTFFSFLLLPVSPKDLFVGVLDSEQLTCNLIDSQIGIIVLLAEDLFVVAQDIEKLTCSELDTMKLTFCSVRNVLLLLAR